MHNSNNDPPCFIDLEASGLSVYSYPIEVAWSEPDGTIESHLISPAGIPDWTDWNKTAARIHGIGRTELLNHGRDPHWMAQRLQARLGGRTVYSDNPDYDAMWLLRLFVACKLPPPSMELRHLDSLLIETCCPKAEHRLAGLRDILELKHTARGRSPGRHRAAWDVGYMLELWRLSQRYGRRTEPSAMHAPVTLRRR